MKGGSPRRAVFLDRDGTINAMVYNAEHGLVDSPANPDELELLPGAADGVRRINELGLLAIVVSNQPGVAKKKFSPRLLDAMTRKMEQALAEGGARLDGVYYCLHHPDSLLGEYRRECSCRKPKAGLLRRAVAEWNVDLSCSYMIGDGVTDVEMGRRAGVTAFFLSSRKCYICNELDQRGMRPDYFASDLLEAAGVIERVEAGDLGGLDGHLFRCESNQQLSSEELEARGRR